MKITMVNVSLSLL